VAIPRRRGHRARPVRLRVAREPEMTRRERHLMCARQHENWLEEFGPLPIPVWIDDAWHTVTDSLMALYHYVLAYAPQEEE